MTRAALVALLLAGCATARPWTVEGASWPEAQAHVREAIRLTGDGRGQLRAGGTIQVVVDQAALDAACPHREGWHSSGCTDLPTIRVLLRLAAPALSHELCHVGLKRWAGGPFGGVRFPTEGECDACALLVMQAVQPGS